MCVHVYMCMSERAWCAHVSVLHMVRCVELAVHEMRLVLCRVCSATLVWMCVCVRARRQTRAW